MFYVNGSMGNPLYVSLAYKDAIVLPSMYIFFMLEMGEPLEGPEGQFRIFILEGLSKRKSL